MTDVTAAGARVTAASDIEVDREALDASIQVFAGPNGDYYAAACHRIHETAGPLALTFNVAAALLGPIWAAIRGVWGFFWAFLLLEIIAWVQIGHGAWGNLGGDLTERAAAQLGRAADLIARAGGRGDVDPDLP